MSFSVSAMRSKERERQRLKADIAAFLENGGKIRQISCERSGKLQFKPTYRVQFSLLNTVDARQNN